MPKTKISFNLYIIRSLDRLKKFKNFEHKFVLHDVAQVSYRFLVNILIIFLLPNNFILVFLSKS